MDPVSARGSVWDSELTPSRGPERPRCRGGLAGTTGRQPCAVAVAAECLVSGRVTKGAETQRWTRGPWTKGAEVPARRACRRHPVSPQARGAGRGSQTLCRRLGPCSVPCPDHDESSCWAGPSMAFPGHLRGHGRAGRTPRHLTKQGRRRGWLVSGRSPVCVRLTAPSSVVRQT